MYQPEPLPLGPFVLGGAMKQLEFSFMKFDRTFCSGAECPKAGDCDRSLQNFFAWAKETGFDLNRPISISNFMSSNPECEHFEPKHD